MSDQDTETLTSLSKTGVKPGIQAIVIKIVPFGMVILQLDDYTASVSLPKEVARSIRVRPVMQSRDALYLLVRLDEV